MVPNGAEVACIDLMAHHRRVGIDEESDAVAKVDLLPSWDLDRDTPGSMFAVIKEYGM